MCFSLAGCRVLQFPLTADVQLSTLDGTLLPDDVTGDNVLQQLLLQNPELVIQMEEKKIEENLGLETVEKAKESTSEVKEGRHAM